jgi:uncharacterized protein (UPF0276 family)
VPKTAALPWMGLGLSVNLDARAVPDPWALHARRPDLFDFVEYSAPLSLAEARAAPRMADLERAQRTLPAVFHPVHLNLHGPELESKRALAALSDHLEAVGSPWVGNDVGWWHQGGAPFPGHLYLPPALDAAGLSDAVAHALHVQAHLPVPLLLENPAVIARRGGMHVLDFMAELHARTTLGLILDLGHLLSHQRAANLPLQSGLDDFPLDAVIEIHIAGGVLGNLGERRFYVDDHSQPVREELFGLLEALLPRCPRLRAVCFEGDGHPEAIAVKTLQRLRTMVPAFAREPFEVALSPLPEPPALQPAAAAWRAFDSLYAERDVASDLQGHQAETDYRLAVVAEALDRTFPLCRLLAAGTRAALLGFTRSAEFRALFDGSGRALPQTFATFVRRRLREKPEPGTEAALALESWALAQSSRPPEPGLAPGVRLASFPLDLSELLFACRAARRHLAARTFGSERLEPGVLESAQQAAARPAPGPWWLALHQTPDGVELTPIDAELLPVLRMAQGGATFEVLAADPRYADLAFRANRLGLLSPGS